MKRSELEQMIREELEEGFMSSFRKGKARGKYRGLKRRGMIKDPLTPVDVLDIPGGSDKDELTGKTYSELAAIWKANNGELDHRGRPVETSTDPEFGETKRVLPLGSLGQKLRAMRKV